MKIKFYALTDIINSNMILAVDWDKENLEFQKETEFKEIEGSLKICQITFDEYVEYLQCLDYDIIKNMMNLGRAIKRGKVEIEEN